MLILNTVSVLKSIVSVRQLKRFIDQIRSKFKYKCLKYLFCVEFKYIVIFQYKLLHFDEIIDRKWSYLNNFFNLIDNILQFRLFMVIKSIYGSFNQNLINSFFLKRKISNCYYIYVYAFENRN